MLSEQFHTFEDHEVSLLVCNGVPWFRGSDVTAALGYIKSALTIRVHVNDDHIKTLKQLMEGIPDVVLRSNDACGRSPLYVSMKGILQFLQHARSPRSDLFKEWLHSQLVPELIGSGCLSDASTSQTCWAQVEYDPVKDVAVDGDALYIMLNPLIPHMIKIGRSIEPEGRAKDLSKSQPFLIVVCYRYNGYGFLERVIHGKLSKRCVVGGRGREWFSIEPHQADLLIRAAILEHQLQT